MNNSCASGIILAAGKQTRFCTEIPKALHPYKDSNIIKTNIDIMSKYTTDINVITSKTNYDYFIQPQYKIPADVKILSIASGYGCGDAVLKSLEKIFNRENRAFLIWGDSIQTNSDLYEICYDNFNDCDMLIPVVKEDSPYVKIITDDNDIVIDVQYSKYSGKLSAGFHDLSFFMFNLINTKNILNDMKNLLWNKYYEKYNNTNCFLPYRNNELIFLDIILYTNLFKNRYKIKAVDVTDYNIKSRSFNSVEEYNEIIKGEND